jgi:two-component system, sensor histidine kinase
MNIQTNHKLDKRTILLVDDQSEQIMVTKSELEKFYTIKVATSGELALKISSMGGVDLILLDIMMPGMDGYETLQYLKLNPDTAEIPVMILTSKQDVEDETKGMDLGAVDFIRKPATPSVLLARVGNIIDLYRTKEQLVIHNKVLEKAIKQADSANREKRRFLATVGHEIRTPMNSILGMAELISESSNNKRIIKHTKIIRQSGQSLIAILNDILDFSKIEAGHIELEKIPFKFDELIKETTDLFKNEAAKKNLKYKVSIDLPWKGVVVADPVRIKQVYSNLISNAIKFTEAGSVRIKIKAIIPEEADKNVVWVRFLVQDTGIGIHKQNLPKLFEEFSQADSTTTRKFGGSGLGLAIIKRLSDLMNGNIHVESKFGKGSCFTIDIPMESNPNISSDQKIKIPDKYKKAKIPHHTRILLVDDDSSNKLVVKGMLGKFELKICTASNGLEAVKKFKAKDYDLILMDCQMPEMDGYTASMEIRKIEQGRNKKKKCPIIGLSAHAMQDDRQKAIKAGMDAYLAKPFGASNLRNVLSYWLSLSSTNPESGASLPTREEFTHHDFLDMVIYRQLEEELGTHFPNVLSAVLSSTLKNSKNIEKSYKRRDSDSLSRAAHTIKGGSAQFGAISLSALAGKIEKLAVEKNWGAIKQVLPEYRKTVEQLLSIKCQLLKNANKV